MKKHGFNTRQGVQRTHVRSSGSIVDALANTEKDFAALDGALPLNHPRRNIQLMTGAWHFDRIADAFVQAATDPSRWASALDILSRETGSYGAVILPVRGRTPFVVSTGNLLEVSEFYFKQGWHMRDRRYEPYSRFISEGVAVDLDFTDEEEMRSDPFYQEFLAHFGLKWGATVRIRAGTDLWSIAIQRRAEHGPFLAAEQRELVDLGSRLSGPATLARAMGIAILDGMGSGLEHANTAAYFVNLEGKLIRANAKARSLLGAGLKVSGGRLACNLPALTARIDQMLAASLGLSGVVSLPLPIAVPKPSGRPLVLHAMPLVHDAALVFSPARAVVLVRDLDDARGPSEAQLQSLFALTRAEARLAIAILAGLGLKEAAERLGISRNTAHTQLGAVFEKTGTKRQAELVALLLQINV